MKTKTFDCVAMKREGAARVYRKTRGMSFQQQVDFWREESEALLAEQQGAKSQKRSRTRG